MHRNHQYGNLSTRDCNVLDALAGAVHATDPAPEATTEEAQAIYLRWATRDKQNPGGWLKAERVAQEWCQVAAFLNIALPVAAHLHEGNPHAVVTGAECVTQVRGFIRERFERMHFPQRGTI